MKYVKTLFAALSLFSFLGMIAGIESSPWCGLLLLPFALFLYLSGGCYESFYRKKSPPPSRAASVKVILGEQRPAGPELPKAC